MPSLAIECLPFPFADRPEERSGALPATALFRFGLVDSYLAHRFHGSAQHAGVGDIHREMGVLVDAFVIAERMFVPSPEAARHGGRLRMDALRQADDALRLGKSRFHPNGIAVALSSGGPAVGSDHHFHELRVAPLQIMHDRVGCRISVGGHVRLVRDQKEVVVRIAFMHRAGFPVGDASVDVSIDPDAKPLLDAMLVEVSFEIVAVSLVPVGGLFAVRMRSDLHVEDLFELVLPPEVKAVRIFQLKQPVQRGIEAVFPEEEIGAVRQLNENIHTIHRVVKRFHNGLAYLQTSRVVREIDQVVAFQIAVLGQDDVREIGGLVQIDIDADDKVELPQAFFDECPVPRVGERIGVVHDHNLGHVVETELLRIGHRHRYKMSHVEGERAVFFQLQTLGWIGKRREEMPSHGV